MNYKEENIFLLDNGDAVNFIKGKEAFVSTNEIKTGEILIDGTAVGDVNDYVMRDRELLASDGMLLIIANINAKLKTVLGTPKIVSKGFVHLHENESMMDEILAIFDRITDKVLKDKYINWNEYKSQVRDEVSKYVYQSSRRRPITIPVIISTEK